MIEIKVLVFLKAQPPQCQQGTFLYSNLTRFINFRFAHWAAIVILSARKCVIRL